MNNWVAEPVDADERYFRTELRYFIMFLANTGLRPGSETRGLRWKDFEARDGYLFIRIVSGKRGAGTSVAQPDVWRFMNSWRQIGKETSDDALVFPGIHNDRGLNNKVKLRVVKLFDDAGVRIGPKGTKRTLYCLRHTYITFALADGSVNVFDLSENTRTSVERLQDTYSDVKTEDYAERVVKRKSGTSERTD
jgi:integrase